MKYFVDINGNRTEVMLDGEGLHVGDELHEAHMSEVEGTPVWLLTEGDAVHRLVVKRGDARGRYTIWMDGFRYDVEAVDERTRVIRDLTGSSAAAAGPAPLKAPMPGLIVRVNVVAGDEIKAGQGLIVMEAMKMENELRAVSAGKVKRVAVAAGQAVEKGALLVEIE